MTYVEQSRVNTIVLGYFFAISQTENYMLTREQLNSAFEGKLGAIRISMALDTMLKDEYAYDARPTSQEYHYALTPEGYRKAESFYLSKDGAVKHITDKGLESFFNFLQGDEQSAELGLQEIPASNRFVTLSDNSSEKAEILDSIEQVDEGFRGSNEVSAEDRTWIRNHLDSGLSLLKKGGQILQSAIKSLIVEPLEAALKAISEEKLKTLISAALKAIRTYLGIF